VSRRVSVGGTPAGADVYTPEDLDAETLGCTLWSTKGPHEIFFADAEGPEMQTGLRRDLCNRARVVLHTMEKFRKVLSGK